MAKNSQPRRPRDVIGNAVHIMRIATGQIDERSAEIAPTKNQAAVALGRLGGLKGGRARAEALSAQKRKAIAKKAAKKRWSKSKT
jgi:hypothetical protein